MTTHPPHPVTSSCSPAWKVNCSGCQCRADEGFWLGGGEPRAAFWHPLLGVPKEYGGFSLKFDSHWTLYS